MKTKVLFLKDIDISGEENIDRIFAYFPDDLATFLGNGKNEYLCYTHIGQHAACHPDYAKACKEAQYNEFADLLKELIGQGYKDLEILNKQEIELHRKPTAGEIKFGEGATHYRSFPIGRLISKEGRLKSKIKAEDGLIYSRA